MRNKLIILFVMLAASLLSGCSASVLIPPLPGPMMIPSAAGSVLTAYAISTDERGFQTIVEDEMIETNIQTAIMGEKELNILELSTYSYNGHVYIIGEYDDKEDFQRIRNIVKKNRKVNSLTTYMFAEKENPQCSSTDDYMLQMAVKTALLDDPSVWGTNFAIKSVHCNIVLMGRVGTLTEAVSARQIAAKVSGVRSVKSFIRSSRENRYSTRSRRVASAIR